MVTVIMQAKFDFVY